MGRITSYPETTELGANDIFLVDGSSGTRKVSAPNAASEFSKLDEESYRLTARLNGAAFDATKIPTSANLNSVDYISQGRYYCDTAELAATYQNCPTNQPFMMEVMSTIQSTIDDESTGVWVYRLRKITVLTGRIFYQFVYSQSTAGLFTYDPWKEVAMTGSSDVISPEMVKIEHITNINGDFSSIGAWILANYTAGRMLNVRVTPTTSGYFGQSTFEIRAMLLSANYGWATLQSDNANAGVVFGRLSAGTWHWYAPALTEVTNASSNVLKNTYENTSIKKGQCICRRQGNVISIAAQGDAVSVAANTVTDWVTIGEAYRPSEVVYIPVANSGVLSRWAMIQTDGKVQLFSTTAISSASNFAFYCSYIVDN